MPPDAPAPPRPAWHAFAVGAALFAGTVLLFSRVLGYGFSAYDDPRYLTNNPYVQAGFAWRSLVWAFSLKADYWHPLSWLSHMLDWRTYGDRAAGHHLSSILWHGVNAVLVFAVLRRLTLGFWTAALGAAWFAWHPLRVESVAWIAERKDVMSGCFFLLMLLAYAAYADRRQQGVPAGRCYLLTLALFLGGLMSKPSLVTAPALLLLLDFWPLRRLEPAFGAGSAPERVSRLLLEKIPFLMLAAGIAGLTLSAQRDAGAFTLSLPLAARCGNALVSVLRYLQKFLWPFDLTVYYPHPGSWPAALVAGAALGFALLTGFVWWQRRRRPWLLVGWVWFLVMLLPMIGLIQVGFQAMADRYTYLSLLGIQIALLAALEEVSVRWRVGRAVAIAGAVLLAGGVVRAWDQEATWRDPVSTLEHALAVTERNDTAEAFLGYVRLGQNRLGEAETHARRALAINPRNDTAWLALAGVCARQNKTGEAAAALREILRIKPQDPYASYTLGELLLRMGDPDRDALRLMILGVRGDPANVAANLRHAAEAARAGEWPVAVACYSVAIAIEPRQTEAQAGLGMALARSGRFDEALACNGAALALDPGNIQAHTETGLILLARHQSGEALVHFRAALAYRPGLVPALVGRGRAAEEMGRREEASASFAQAIASAPDDPLVLSTWAAVLSRRGDFAAALVHYRRIVRLRPDAAEAHALLGMALLMNRQKDAALTEWEEALRLDPALPGLRERLEQFRR